MFTSIISTFYENERDNTGTLDIKIKWIHSKFNQEEHWS